MIQPVGEKPPPERVERMRSELAELRRELDLCEAWVFGCPLNEPRESTVLRFRDEQVFATDGPYAEGTEYVGGIVVIKTDSLEAALKWGAQYAKVTGLPVEVRPFQGEC
jgi:hypothetical protein